MKKVFFTLAISLLFITGCGSKGDTITCTSTEFLGEEINNKLIFELKGDKVKSIDFSSKVVLEEEALKDVVVEFIKDEYSSIEDQFGIKANIDSTGNTINASIKLNEEQASQFIGSDNGKVSRNEIISTFEDSGFECK